jgi:hypothetical protein
MPTSQELESICKIAGTPMYPWAITQLKTRSNQGSQKDRSDDNLLYLANKGAWIRVVSSVNIEDQLQKYFKDSYQIGLANDRSLAENFILYGGTSTYAFKSQQFSGQVANVNVNTGEIGDILGSRTQGMNLRSGLDAYSIAGNQEIQGYGYRPMPGITSVTIESTGRLGSLRQATINFKVWDKYQLDIMDALYFRPGFTVLIEWGHAKYYDNSGNLQSSEQYMMNPFKAGLTKEAIQIELNVNAQRSAGNYGGMLGMVTNFNFSMTQDGGYDCTIKAMALGSVLGSFPINHAAVLPDTYYEQVSNYLSNGRTQEIAKFQLQAQQDYEKALAQALEKINSSTDIWAKFLQNNQEKLKFADLSLINLTFNTRNLTFNKSITRVSQDIRANLESELTANVIPIYDDVISSADEYKAAHDISGYVTSTSENIRAYYFESERNTSTTIPLTNIKIPTNRGVIYFDQPGIQKKYIASKDTKGQGNVPISVKLDIASMNSTISGLNTKPIGSNKIFTAGDFFDTIRQNNNSFSYNYQNNAQNFGPYIIKIEYDQRQLAQSKTDITNPETTWEVISVISNVNSKNRNPQGTKIGTMDLEIKLGAYKNVNTVTTTNVTQSVGTFASVVTTTQTSGSGQFDYIITIGSHSSFGDLSGYLGDLSFIREVITTANNQPLITNKVYDDYITAISDAEKAKQNYLDSQGKSIDDKYNTEQLKATIQGESTIELMLRSFMLYCINNPTKLNKKKRDEYIKSLFSEGAYKNIFSNGIPEEKKYTYNDLKRYVDGSMTAADRLEMNMRYGNNFYLMSCQNVLDNSGNVKFDFLDNLPQVNFKDLFNAVIIPYGKSVDIEVENKPDASVYINLGLFFLMLNHTGILYNKENIDKMSSNETITPMAYLDFNPETNYYLSSENQFSIDPYKFIVKFPSTAKTYQKLFDEKLIPNGVITYKTKKYVEGEPTPREITLTEPLFNPKEDIVSKVLSETKTGVDSSTPNGYIGKLMNVQVEINYLLEIMKNYRMNSDSHEVYFQSMIERILSDLNKCMGYYNAFRLSYDDAANCYVITDDQVQSKPLSSLESTFTKIIENPQYYEIPVYGSGSVARSFDLNSDMSTRLASYLAISSNPGAESQVVTSKNTTDIGVYNTGSYDRYIPKKVDGTAEPNKNNTQNAQAAELAANFNSVVSKIYTDKRPIGLPGETQEEIQSQPNISESDIDRAIGYYIDRMAKVKNAQQETPHAMIIPLAVRITMDGMSGIYPFQLFTIDERILPYRYSRSALNQKMPGFTITKITNSFESNQWTTSIEGKMTLIKNPSPESDQKLTVQIREVPESGVVIVNSADFTLTREQIIQKIVTKMRSLGYSNKIIAAFLGNFEVETNFDAKKIFTDSADPANNAPNIGLAQWQKTRKDQLLAQFDYNTIEGQIDFVHYELTKGKFINVLNELKTLSDREEAALKAGEIVAEKYEVASKDSKYSEAYFNRSEFALNFYKELIANKYP